MLFFSTQKLYEKIAQGEVSGFIMPAFNIRTLTFDVARALFRAAKKEKAGAFIIELAQSEMVYTSQTPREYKKKIARAAKKEGFSGPIFLQGDHFKLDPKKPEKLEKLIPRVIKCGFYNIDIDCSSLPLKENYSQTAKFTSFIRKLEPKNLTISVGGEVGEIGGKNTTPAQLQEFMEGYRKELSNYGKLKGIIKIAVQTGTSHGKGGQTDFQVLENLIEKARQYRIAGVVQHGASTLPPADLEKLVKAGVLEIHLATEFQNIILNSDYFPQKLREKIQSKKDLGLFKKEILTIPQKNVNKICEEIEEKFRFFFQIFKVSGTENLIQKIYIKN